jgi:hypothetical protein
VKVPKTEVTGVGVLRARVVQAKVPKAEVVEGRVVEAGVPKAELVRAGVCGSRRAKNEECQKQKW